MKTKSRQKTLSPENENILKNGASTIEQGWFDVQTLLDRSDVKNADEVIDQFLEHVDDSNYSLTDWLAALLDFDKWLTDQNVDARPLETMIGYIHCSTMGAPQTLAAPELSRVVLKNLEEWGFDAVATISQD